MAADDALIEEIRERRITATNDWDEPFAEAKKDRLCIAGKVWEAMDPKGKKQREEAKRPYLALDELGQYINQTVNDVRANPRGIKFAPTGNGANDDGAEFYQNHTREIEYRSHAKVAYATAFESAVSSSFGWLRVTTKRQHARTFDKELWIEPIVNPDQVLADPNSTWPDSRDMKYLYFIESWPKSEADREFKTKVAGLGPEWTRIASQWVRKDTIDLAEYWKLETVQRKLIAYRQAGGAEGSEQFALEDELEGGKLPAGVDNLREEMVDDTTVKAYLTNGIEVLKEIPWKGKHIPFVSCLGKVIYVDEGEGAKRKLLSMTRLARDPFMLYCYYRTCEAELVGMTPKFPYFAYEGQLSADQLTLLQKSLHEPVAVVQVRPFVEGGLPNQPLGFPARQPYEPPIQALELGAEAARRAIQAAMGISPLPTDAQRHTQKSGVALRQIESSGQKGSFHFVDHYELMIERTGVILEDLMDKTLDTARDVPVRDQHDSAKVVRINDPRDPDSISTKGDYRVTVSTGPADASQRESADNFVDAMVSNIQTIAQLVGRQKAAQVFGKSVKLKQLGPIGDEIAELLMPPEPPGANGKPLPPEAQALMQENQQLKAQLQQAAQTIESDVHKEQAKIEGQKQIEGMRIDFDREKLARESETKITVAELGAKVDRLTLFLEERARLGMQGQDAAEAAKDRTHDLNMATLQHVSQVTQASQGQQHALEQGAQGVAGQMAVASIPQPGDEAAGAGA